jgi:protein-S-isoprenylcysteine O-methyltransferase Ste14
MPLAIRLWGVFFPVLFVFFFWVIAKSEKLRNKSVRSSIILMGMVLLASLVFVLPFVPQPRLASTHLRYVAGIPLAALGMTLRMYPLIYFKKREKRPGFARLPKSILTLHGPAYFITGGPFGVVRQPQYAGGVLFLIGWFLIWGCFYTLYILPALVIFIWLWAVIEEKYVLEKEFGDEYREYKKKVGMFFSKNRKEIVSVQYAQDFD